MAIGTKAKYDGMVNAIIGVFIVLALLAAFVGIFFDQLASFYENLTGVSTGNTAADAIVVALALVVLILGALYFVNLALDAFSRRTR